MTLLEDGPDPADTGSTLIACAGALPNRASPHGRCRWPRLVATLLCSVAASATFVSVGPRVGAALTETEPPPSPADEQTLSLPRTVTYGGLAWTIESASFAPAEASDPSSPAASARVGFTVVNQLDDTIVSFPAELLALSLADGSIVRAASLEGTESAFNVELEPGAAITGTAVFELDPGVDSVDLTQTAFVVAEPGRTPAVAPLSGPPEANAYPIVGMVDNGGPASMPGSCPVASTVEITVVGATATVDLGAQRADVGTHFVTIDLQLRGIDGELDYACVDGPFFRLTDGTATSPPIAGTDVSESIDVGTSVETSVTFVVSVDADSLELGIGADGQTVTTVPLSFPPPAQPAGGR